MSITELGFTGWPFDALAFIAPETAKALPGPTGTLAPAVAAPAVAGPAAGSMAAIARELRAGLVRAHGQALRAEDVLQRKALRSAGRNTSGRPQPASIAVPPGLPDEEPAALVPVPVTSEARFKPLARTAVCDLDTDALARLAEGDIAGVFGPAYDQDGANPDIRLEGAMLASVSGLSPRAGVWGLGGLTARTVPLDSSHPVQAPIVAAVTQAAQVAAMFFGLHLCLADATLVDQTPGMPPARVLADLSTVSGPVELVIDITAVDLVPRPYLRADAEVRADGIRIGRVRQVTVAVVEKPGVPVGPGPGGVPPRWLGRCGADGEHALLSEFHLAHWCRGDQAVALGPEFGHYTGRKATRPPGGGLMLVDRVMELSATRGVLDKASHRTEYGSPADSWYYADTANASMPHCIYLETSLQAALILGYFIGPTLMAPDEAVSLRNLSGTATVLREVDLRDKTVSQHSHLLSTSLVPSFLLQDFAYTLSVNGAPFYRGETLFGYLGDAVMASQTGLDAGQDVPTWLAAQRPQPAHRTLKAAVRRADPTARLVSRGHLALLNDIQVVDGGGRFGLGYLRAARAIDPDEWFFARHFPYDPVIPGSLGVEAVVQAMQEWLLDAGHGEHLRNPGFVLPTGLPFSWKYRGQLVPTDREFILEVHIKSIERRAGRVRAAGDASIWKPGLRIYELTGIAVELREEGAPPW